MAPSLPPSHLSSLSLVCVLSSSRTSPSFLVCVCVLRRLLSQPSSSSSQLTFQSTIARLKIVWSLSSHPFPSSFIVFHVGRATRHTSSPLCFLLFFLFFPLHPLIASTCPLKPHWSSLSLAPPLSLSLPSSILHHHVTLPTTFPVPSRLFLGRLSVQDHWSYPSRWDWL